MSPTWKSCSGTLPTPLCCTAASWTGNSQPSHDFIPIITLISLIGRFPVYIYCFGCRQELHQRRNVIIFPFHCSAFILIVSFQINQRPMLGKVPPCSGPASFLAQRQLSEINYRETVFIASPLWGRRLPRREQPSDTLSLSPALIVQKMWFVPLLYFPGKRGVCKRARAPVAWTHLLFICTVFVCVCVSQMWFFNH